MQQNRIVFIQKRCTKRTQAWKSLLSKGHKYDFKSNVLSKLDNIVFFSEMPKDGSSYIKILGLDGSKRTEKWIRKDLRSCP